MNSLLPIEPGRIWPLSDCGSLFGRFLGGKRYFQLEESGDPGHKPVMDLKEFREGLGLNQAQAAKKAKISAAAFCSAELGTRYPSADTALKIMAFSYDPKTGVVDVTAHDLLATWAAKHRKKVPGAPTSA